MPQEAPAIESSFLFVREVPQDDGNVHFEEGFTHDTYRDFFRARAFAKRINGGQETIDDSFENRWSCKAHEWSPDDETKVLDLAHQDVVLFIADMLERPHVRQLVHLLSKEHLASFRDGEHGMYKSSHSMYTALRIVGTRDIGDNELEGMIYTAFLEADIHRDLHELLDSRHSIPLLIRMVESRSKHATYAIPLLKKYKVKEAKEALISFMDSGHPESWEAADALLTLGFEEGVPFLRRCASDPEHPKHVQIAYTLYRSGYHDVVNCLFTYASDPNHPGHVDIACDLLEWGYKDVLADVYKYASDSSHPGSVKSAYTLFGCGYPEGFDYLLNCALNPGNPSKNEAIELLKDISLRKGGRELLVDTFMKIYEKAREGYSLGTGYIPPYSLHYVLKIIFHANDDQSKARVYRDLEGPGEELHRQILHAIAKHKPKGAAPYVRAYISRLKACEPDDSEGPLIKLVKTRKRENQIDLAMSAL